MQVFPFSKIISLTAFYPYLNNGSSASKYIRILVIQEAIDLKFFQYLFSVGLLEVNLIIFALLK